MKTYQDTHKYSSNTSQQNCNHFTLYSSFIISIKQPPLVRAWHIAVLASCNKQQPTD